MNKGTKPWTGGVGRLVYNPHFWAILLTLIILSLLYWGYYYTDIDADGGWRDWFWYVEVAEFSNDIHGSLFCRPSGVPRC